MFIKQLHSRSNRLALRHSSQFSTEAHSVPVKMCVSKMSYISYNYDSTIKNISLYDARISFLPQNQLRLIANATTELSLLHLIECTLILQYNWYIVFFPSTITICRLLKIFFGVISRLLRSIYRKKIVITYLVHPPREKVTKTCFFYINLYI